MSTDYIYVKDHLEGQVIKNTDTEEVFFLIWSHKKPVELLTKVLEDGSEVLAYKINSEDTLLLQQFLTKLEAAPDKRIFKVTPSSYNQEKVGLFTKLKRLFTDV